MMSFLAVWWPFLFALGTVAMMCSLDPAHANQFPPPIDLSGSTAMRVLTSPWALGTLIPMLMGMVWIRWFAKSNKLSTAEQGHMVWWMANLFWFHCGCDIFSGYLMQMPALTELYKHMSPAHHLPRWHEARSHLDSGYILELLVEVPLAALVLFLYWRRDAARGVVEVFAAAVQLAGTVTYYSPALMAGEFTCWLSYVDRSVGCFWIVFPLVILRRHMVAVQPAVAKAGKAKKKWF